MFVFKNELLPSLKEDVAKHDGIGLSSDELSGCQARGC